ncbi:MAG TPA: response regulator [Kineosporiaceae bacterium]
MIRVLVVDDQPEVVQAHAELVNAVDGFRTVGMALDGRTALARVGRGDVDVVLLDLTMPGMDGIEVCRQLSALEDAPDVIVVTAVRDMGMVRAAVRHGAVLYLVKPFRFATLRERLRQYAAYVEASACQEAIDQRQIDDALATLRAVAPTPVPKTLSAETLDAVRAALVGSGDGLTSAEVAVRTGMARVTARRYLEHLVTTGICLRVPVYGRTGRPVLRYRVRG